MAEIINAKIIHKQVLRELKRDFIKSLVRHMKNPHGYVVLSWDENMELRVDSDSVAFITKENLDIMLDVIDDELEVFVEV